MNRMKPTHAGCIVFRTEGGEKSYLILSSSTNAHWILPQGHIETSKGESAGQAALRELKEEAGVIGEIIEPLSQQTFIKKGELVTIQYFIIRMTGMTAPKEKRTLRWEDEDTALKALSFEEAKQTFREALGRIRNIT
jgi:ADP-ribose pyrophosphatase YjhB (NUDIX family)